MRAKKHLELSRFVDNDNGTVTDNLTKLTWLKNANAFGRITWKQTMSDVKILSSGLIGLTDGSKAGDWRLPSIKELQSLVDFAYYSPALSGAVGTSKWTEGDVFVGVQSGNYWSGTTYSFNMTFAWIVYLYNGFVCYDDKTYFNYVWPVRKDKAYAI